MSLNPEPDVSPKARIMVCEDEFIVALDLQLLIEEFGYEVIGPFASVEKAIEMIEVIRPDGAVLDVRLQDGEVFPLADKLAELGVPLVFHSGHVNADEIRAKYPDAACCQKPVNTRQLELELKRLPGGRLL